VVVTDAPSATPVEDVVEQETDVVMKDNVFEPGTITLAAGKEFRINLDNQGKFAHNLRIAGPDGEFETDDDIVSPDVPPGQKDDVTAQIDEPGEYAFRDDFHHDMTGTLTIE
jgi:plastocyanin